MNTRRHTADVVVVGGGIIGLAIAWRLARAGVGVTVCDDRPGRGASWVAAGLLAPVTEVHPGEDARPFLALALAAAERWPAFAAELEACSGSGVDLRLTGTLVVAADDDDRRALGAIVAFQRNVGLRVEQLDRAACRRLEPLLHPRIRGGAHVPGDHAVDNRLVVHALCRAAERAGVEFVTERVTGVVTSGGRLTGVRLRTGGDRAVGAVVVATGADTARLALPPGCVPPVRPVKGQVLRLEVPDPRARPGRPVRGLVAGRSVYVVPRSGAEVVVGATVEERADPHPTAGGAHELLEAALAVLPGLAEARLAEVSAGVRPATPDHAPVLGSTPVEGLVLAVGHHRNGVLLAPVTAELVAGWIVEGRMGDLDGRLPGADAFSLARFA